MSKIIAKEIAIQNSNGTDEIILSFDENGNLSSDKQIPKELISGLEDFVLTTITEYTEPVYTASSGTFDRANGGVQFYTLTASESLTFAMDSGQDMELHLFGTDTYTASWPAGTKFLGGSPPDLSTYTEAVIEVFKRGTDLYIADVGDYY